ncbi:MAG: acetyl-CoA C-acetyltransferase [Chitinophagales bacterium]|nr:acetyl-CoA C-acetyltransferase [Chitinophagales bacterium]
MDAFIYDTLRTVRGKGSAAKGALSVLTPEYIGRYLLQEFHKKNQFDPNQIEELILGCVSQTLDQGSDIAKTIAMTSGYGTHISGYTVNRFCGSGLEAINQAAAYLKSGYKTKAVIAGGIESMSRVPMGADFGAYFFDPAVSIPHNVVPQGISADLIASKYGYSRAELDSLAVESNKRAYHAQENGFFKSRIALKDFNGYTVLDTDENIRQDTTLESLSKLNSSFEKLAQMAGYDEVALDKYPEVEKLEFLHHPGNSSAIVDGAAIMLLGTQEMSNALGMKPRAKIVSTAVVSTEPTIMLTGPAPASRLALARAGMSVSDIDLFEVNEAFASVVLRFMEDLGVPHQKTNVNGGAIAMGHPLGATGCMILGTLLDELERRNLSTGLATLCIGGGMGIATIIERV